MNSRRRASPALRPGWPSGAARVLPAPWIPGTPRRSPRTGAPGSLTSALRSMSMTDVRCLLRRLDASFKSPARSVVHWTEALRISPADRISKLRLAAMRLRDGGESHALDAREVLDLARELREQAPLPAAARPSRSPPICSPSRSPSDSSSAWGSSRPIGSMRVPPGSSRPAPTSSPRARWSASSPLSGSSSNSRLGTRRRASSLARSAGHGPRRAFAAAASSPRRSSRCSAPLRS